VTYPKNPPREFRIYTRKTTSIEISKAVEKNRGRGEKSMLVAKENRIIPLQKA
jgi:hypothetical protein